MRHEYNDGGRAAAGFKGKADDCVARAVAIASGRPYADVYARLAKETGAQRSGKAGKRAASARDGINTTRAWFRAYMRELGFEWFPTMRIGTGTMVHLRDGELPSTGSYVVSVSKHMCAVVDGVIHDTHDPSRNGTRCVYGYWALVR